MLDKMLNIRGTLTSLATPLVMGILNITPDSFYAGSRKQTETAIEDRIREILSEGGIGSISVVIHPVRMPLRLPRRKRCAVWSLPYIY